MGFPKFEFNFRKSKFDGGRKLRTYIVSNRSSDLSVHALPREQSVMIAEVGATLHVGCARRASMIASYTDHAANERAFLAWLRTGPAVVAFGFFLIKLIDHPLPIEVFVAAP
jgi:hypothetical protein